MEFLPWFGEKYIFVHSLRWKQVAWTQRGKSRKNRQSQSRKNSNNHNLPQRRLVPKHQLPSKMIQVSCIQQEFIRLIKVNHRFNSSESKVETHFLLLITQLLSIVKYTLYVTSNDKVHQNSWRISLLACLKQPNRHFASVRAWLWRRRSTNNDWRRMKWGKQRSLYRHQRRSQRHLSPEIKPLLTYRMTSRCKDFCVIRKMFGGEQPTAAWGKFVRVGKVVRACT